jgi:hypothetical protein
MTCICQKFYPSLVGHLPPLLMALLTCPPRKYFFKRQISCYPLCEPLLNPHLSGCSGESAMEGGGSKTWRFASPNPAVAAAGEKSIQRYLLQLHACLDERGPRPVIPLSHGDPSSSPSFRTAPEAEEAVVAAVRSGEYNGYSSPTVALPARRSVPVSSSRCYCFRTYHGRITLNKLQRMTCVIITYTMGRIRSNQTCKETLGVASMFQFHEFVPPSD